MKKIIGLALLAIVSTTSIAQKNALDKYFSEYQENEDFTKVNVSGKLFELASYLETDDEDIQEVKEFSEGIKSLKTLIGHDISDGFGKYEKALSKVEKNYEELMSVDDKNGKFTFFIDENSGVVNEFVVIGTADSMLCLVSLTGYIDLKKLGSISQKIQAEGFDYISKMNENGANDIKVYPNPAPKNNSVTVNIPEELNGADLNIYNSGGTLLVSEKALGSTMNVSTSDFNSGTHILEFTKGDISIKKKLIIK